MIRTLIHQICIDFRHRQSSTSPVNRYQYFTANKRFSIKYVISYTISTGIRMAICPRFPTKIISIVINVTPDYSEHEILFICIRSFLITKNPIIMTRIGKCHFYVIKCHFYPPKTWFMALLLRNITCKNKKSSGDSSLHTYLAISLILQVADIRPVSGLIFYARSGRFSHPRLSEPWAVSGRTWAFLCCLYRARSPIIFLHISQIFSKTNLTFYKFTLLKNISKIC